MGSEEESATTERRSGDRGAHDAETVEQGAFAHARCSCGWRGPARRARERARSDAAAHLPEVG